MKGGGRDASRLERGQHTSKCSPCAPNGQRTGPVDTCQLILHTQVEGHLCKVGQALFSRNARHHHSICTLPLFLEVYTKPVDALYFAIAFRLFIVLTGPTATSGTKHKLY